MLKPSVAHPNADRVYRVVIAEPDPAQTNRSSLLIGNFNLHYVNKSGVRINVHYDRYVLTVVALEGGGVIHFIVFVVFVIGETLAVGTYASRHVLSGLRVILIWVVLILIWGILILLATALLRRCLNRGRNAQSQRESE